MESLEFKQDVAGSNNPWNFMAMNMSDGTLRALGVLVALFQGTSDYSPTFIGIEEPETALHPAASAALRAFTLTSFLTARMESQLSRPFMSTTEHFLIKLKNHYGINI
jgi:predicted ATPase